MIKDTEYKLIFFNGAYVQILTKLFEYFLIGVKKFVF